MTRFDKCADEKMISEHFAFWQCSSRNAESPFRFLSGARTASFCSWQTGHATPATTAVNAPNLHSTTLSARSAFRLTSFSNNAIFFSDALAKFTGNWNTTCHCVQWCARSVTKQNGVKRFVAVVEILALQVDLGGEKKNLRAKGVQSFGSCLLHEKPRAL